MAETAIGVVGLLGLFSTAVDCFQYVQIAKTFDRDFGTSQLKLDIAGDRLARWGEAVGIREGNHFFIPLAQYKKAERILTHLETLFTQAQDKASIFEQPDTLTYDTGDMDQAQAIVHRGVVNKMRTRIDRSHVSLLQKTKWAIYKKKELNSLIGDITDLANQLEIVVPPSQTAPRTLQSFVEVEIEEIQQSAVAEQTEVTPLQVAEVLHEAAEGLDPHLEEAVKNVIKQLSPQTQSSGTTNNLTWTMEGNDNKGIIAGVYHGNQTNHYGT